MCGQSFDFKRILNIQLLLFKNLLPMMLFIPNIIDIFVINLENAEKQKERKIVSIHITWEQALTFFSHCIKV